jgi:hypothetical protein
MNKETPETGFYIFNFTISVYIVATFQTMVCAVCFEIISKFCHVFELPKIILLDERKRTFEYFCWTFV